MRIDVTDEASVAAAAKWIETEYGRLDILVNNAGIVGGPAAHQPSAAAAEQVREVYETNVFGVVTVTNAMLPLLRRSEAGRIVNVSSELGSLAMAGDPESPFLAFNALAYNSSKSALNMVTVCYAKELKDTPIKVNAGTPATAPPTSTGTPGPVRPSRARRSRCGWRPWTRTALPGPT
ncbi:SDR family NAD(P)-dependent oxidoreductase [Nonomuraea antimicrobica]